MRVSFIQGDSRGRHVFNEWMDDECVCACYFRTVLPYGPLAQARHQGKSDVDKIE